MSQPDSNRLVEVLRVGIQRASLSPRQYQILHRILACGTGALGHHIYRCKSCSKIHLVAHSCRDRHCPRCQHREADQWLQKQRASLLPVPYFHLVFTLPHQLNDVISQNPAKCLNLLFQAAGSTVLTFGKTEGFQPGVTAVLHTWGQTLCRHYHVHLIVTGGGLSKSEDEWIGVDNPKWLFSTRALSRVYQARYLAGLKKLFRDGQLTFHGKLKLWAESDHFARQLRTLSRRKWNVYAKAPFGGSEQVLRYLSLYTHRIAITAGRVLRFDAEADEVTFRYRNYRKTKNPWETMKVSVGEFTRRFSNHILPKRFCKIRHYGIQSTRNRKTKIALCQYYLSGNETDLVVEEAASNEVVGAAGLAEQTPPEEERSEPGAPSCPNCGSTRMKLVRVTRSDGGIDEPTERGPPET